ncbi:MAG: EndoU domain-containing protein [Spirulinaceae cyanobacterium]
MVTRIFCWLRDTRLLSYALFAILVVFGFHLWLTPAQAQINCQTLPHWSSTSPVINLHHVFCGEFNHGRPKGLHSRPGGANPATVAELRLTEPANAQGIYGARWSYRGHTDLPKFSTFFPDRCNRNQVLQSVAYAANHLTACPAGAPSWARCGANQPSGGNAASYCTANNGQRFSIALGLLNDGRVNTAFPLR